MKSAAPALDCVKAFRQAAETVLQEVLAVTPRRGQERFQLGAAVALQPINVAVGITGEIAGHVNIGFDEQTARAIAAGMLAEDVPELNELAISALSELANMMAGNARSHLSAAGLVTDITPPTVMRGEGILGSWQMARAMSVPLEMPQGVITVTLVLGPRDAG